MKPGVDLAATLTSRWFRYQLHPLARQGLTPGPALIPGVEVLSDQSLRVPENARPVIEHWLKFSGTEYSVALEGNPRALRQYSWEEILKVIAPKLTDLALERLGRCAFQREGIEFGCNRAGGALYWSTGSGKTAAALALALASPGPVIFVTRASTRGTQRVPGHIWREVRQYTRESVVILEGETVTQLRPKRPVPGQSLPRFFILSWESLPAWGEELLRLGATTVIWDESHRGKQSTGFKKVEVPEEDAKALLARLGRWKKPPVFTEIVKGADPVTGEPTNVTTYFRFSPLRNRRYYSMKISRAVRRRYGLTATPVGDRLRDLWAQLDAIDPKAWGDRRSFDLHFCDGKPGTYGWDNSGRSNVEELQARLLSVAHVVSYSRANAELPPKRRSVLHLDGSQLVREVGSWKSELRAAKGNPSSEMEVELQIAASRKRKIAVEMTLDVLRSGGKVVVFSGRRKDVETLWEVITKEAGKIGVSADRVIFNHGGVSDDERELRRLAYIEVEAPAAYIATMDAEGEGVDGLQGSDQLICVMLPWTPLKVIQMEGRLQRRGRTTSALIVYLVAAGTIDERVAEVLIEKLPAVEMVTGDEQVMGISLGLKGLENPDELARGMLAGFAKPSEVTL